MNSKTFILAGYCAWYLTFLVGFFILAPSTDDGYYLIASLGTALTGSTGFWIGDTFSPALFLPTAFTYFYGLLLKLTMILNLDFGPFGFRFYQFIFVLLIPLSGSLMLRRFYPGEHGFRLLLLIMFLSLTYFVQSAATVRPEVLGAVLFFCFLSLSQINSERRALPAFLLALCGVVHPNFTLLALAIFGAGLIRNVRSLRLSHLGQWTLTCLVFALPFVMVGAHYVLNIAAFEQQTLGRAGVLSNDFGTAPSLVWKNLWFWENSVGIPYGLFSGYPALGLISAMLISTVLVLCRGMRLWADGTLWISWPILFIQWIVFLLLPPFLPYLAFSSFLAGVNIALLCPRPPRWVLNGWSKWMVASCGFACCLTFIIFQAGKFALVPGGWLTPSGLHSVMAPVLEGTNAKFYTRSARLIPPLIDYFSENDSIRINFLYLSPDCLQSGLLESANQHSLVTLTSSDVQNTYWGFARRTSNKGGKGEISFVVKGAQSIVT